MSVYVSATLMLNLSETREIVSNRDRIGKCYGASIGDVIDDVT